ncbi:MAG: hypothetical protein ACJ77K_05015 [Bacteroidia bacterium]
MVSLLKFLAVICFSCIMINSVHFAMPLIFFVVAGFDSEQGLWTIMSFFLSAALIGMIVSAVMPNEKRDKLLIPISSTILLSPIVIHIADHGDADLLRFPYFYVPAAAFFFLTVIITILTFRKK